MDIVTLRQCLKNFTGSNQTDKEVKVHKLLDVSYRESIVKTLNKKELGLLINFLDKYPPFLTTNFEEEIETISSHEKLAVNKFRQYGLMFKFNNHPQQYVVPYEIGETLVSSMIEKKQKRNLVTPNKTYLFLLFTIIRLVEEKTIRSNEQLEKYLLEKVNHYDQTLLHLLLSFLVEEKIVVKVNKKLLICYERCSEVIGGNTIPLEMRLAYYVCYANLTANFSSLFLAFIVSTYNDQQFCVSDLNTYLTKSKQAPKELVLANALNQLNSSGLVVKENETVYTISHETIDALSGVQISPFEILVPVFAHNRDLWTFMTWGDLGEWESMIHFTFSTQSFARALKNEQTLSQLIECLEKYFPKDTINDWKELFAEWVKKVTPIKKKTNMTFFPLADHLQKQLIKKQWSLWAIWAEEGIVIESINEVQFEKLLTDLGLQTSNEAIKKEKVEKQEINISNEIPSLNEGLSELDHIPKQWFHLTSYEERTRLRVVKQAILLQVFLQLEIGNEVDVLQPVKLEVANGHYTIVSKEGRKVSLDKVKRIAMIHPINIEEAKE